MKCRFSSGSFLSEIPSHVAKQPTQEQADCKLAITLLLFYLNYRYCPLSAPSSQKLPVLVQAYLQTPLVNKHANTEKPTEFPILQWGPQPPAPPMKLHSFLSKFDRVDCPTITLETASGPPVFSKPYRRSHCFDAEVKFQCFCWKNKQA